MNKPRAFPSGFIEETFTTNYEGVLPLLFYDYYFIQVDLC